MSNLAIFGGTFDPIHNGHLYIARAIIEELKFEQLVLIPNHIPPHKGTHTTPEHRLAMLNLALTAANVDNKITINAVEMSRPGKSYTIDTIVELKKTPAFADQNFWLVLGLDAFYYLPTWRNWLELQKHVNFIVFDRQIQEPISLDVPAWVKPYLQEKQVFQIPDDSLGTRHTVNGQVFMANFDPINVSATKIRQLFQLYYQLDPHSDEAVQIIEQLNIMLPEEVVKYIIACGLYH